MRMQVFKISGIPVYIKWSILITIAFMIYLNSFSAIASMLSIFAYIFLIFVHELGHFYFAKRAGLRVFEIQISAVGGHCLFEATNNRIPAFLVSAGGLIFQTFLLVFSVILVLVSTKELLVYLEPILLVFIHFNIFAIIINAIPANLPGGRKNDGMYIFNLLRAKN